MALVDKDLVEAALFEQHRWEFNCEKLYRKALTSPQIEVAFLDDMLRTFGIARNLSSDGKVVLREQLQSIAKVYKEAPGEWERIFELTCVAQSKSKNPFYIKGSDSRPNSPRCFVSGLTKVLWFADAHKLPMFDTFTSSVVKCSGNTQAQRAANFYRKLEDVWKYSQVFSALENVKKNQKISWCFFPERLLDKLLLIKGVRKKNTLDERFLLGSANRRSIYIETLGRPLGEELRGLVEPICQALDATAFNNQLSECAIPTRGRRGAPANTP